MGDAVTANQSNRGETADDGNHHLRRYRSGNSDLFNQILSAANGLSVAERTRLVKSLAGQLGLLTVGGQLLLDKPDSSGGKKGKTSKSGESAEAAPLFRPNPLKGTKFWVDKESAKADMLKAREAAGGAQLQPGHPAVTAYAVALKAYKDEQAKLKPVAGVTKSQQQRGDRVAKQQGSKRRAERSPVRSGGFLAGAASFAKRMSGAPAKSADAEMGG